MILNNLLIRIQESSKSLMELEYETKYILREKLDGVMSNFNKIVETSTYLNNIVKAKKLKIDIDKLIPIKIPKREDEIEQDYDQYIVGFGEISWEINKCLGCRSCVDICPENAIKLLNNLDLKKVIEIKGEDLETLPENKKMLYNLIKKLALKKPDKAIILPENYLGLGNIEVIPLSCIACKKCEEKCPNNAIEFKNVWNFPEVMRKFLDKIAF